jgi:hypothetical protein
MGFVRSQYNYDIKLFVRVIFFCINDSEHAFLKLRTWHHIHN